MTLLTLLGTLVLGGLDVVRRSNSRHSSSASVTRKGSATVRGVDDIELTQAQEGKHTAPDCKRVALASDVPEATTAMGWVLLLPGLYVVP